MEQLFYVIRNLEFQLSYKNGIHKVDRLLLNYLLLTYFANIPLTIFNIYGPVSVDNLFWNNIAKKMLDYDNG